MPTFTALTTLPDADNARALGEAMERMTPEPTGTARVRVAQLLATTTVASSSTTSASPAHRRDSATTLDQPASCCALSRSGSRSTGRSRRTTWMMSSIDTNSPSR